MAKSMMTVTIDHDLYTIISNKFKGKMSGMVEKFFKDMVDFEQNEETPENLQSLKAKKIQLEEQKLRLKAKTSVLDNKINKFEKKDYDDLMSSAKKRRENASFR